MVERQRLLVKDIDGSTGDLPGFERGNQIRLYHDRSARRVHQAGCGFHDRKLRGADQTARPIAKDDMDGDHIRPPEQFLLGDQLSVHCRCALGRQILTPGNHMHAECLADLGDGAADIPETENAQCSPGHVIADEPLPTAAPQRCVFGDEMAGTGQDKRPGQFDRWR